MTSKIVCGVGVPHVPVFPRMAARGDDGLLERFSRIRRLLEASRPSLLVVVATDHLNGYFLDRLPTFSISLGDLLWGPVEDVEGICRTALKPDPVAATHLADALVRDGFDMMQSRDTGVDHSTMVPLHFLNPTDRPVVVLNVNAYVPPLPTARRCHALGIALARAVELLPGDRRVAVIASGSFSQDVGGPTVDEGRAWSVPRPDWASRVAHGLAVGDLETILAEATPAMLASAGSVAGELLGWITMVSAVTGRSPGPHPIVDHRPGEAFAFGAWAMEGLTG